MNLIKLILHWLKKIFTPRNNKSPYISAGGSVQAGGDILVGSVKSEINTVNYIQNNADKMITEKSRNGIKTRKEYDPTTETERVISVALGD